MKITVGAFLLAFLLFSLLPIFGFSWLTKSTDKEIIESFGEMCQSIDGTSGIGCAGDFIECSYCAIKFPIREQVPRSLFGKNFCERWIDNNYGELANVYDKKCNYDEVERELCHYEREFTSEEWNLCYDNCIIPKYGIIFPASDYDRQECQEYCMMFFGCKKYTCKMSEWMAGNCTDPFKNNGE